MGAKLKIIAAAAVLVIGILMIPALAHYRAKAMVTRYRNELIARGEKLTVAEAAPMVSADEAAEAREMGTVIQMLGRGPIISNMPPAMPMLSPGHALLVWREMVMPNDEASNVWPAALAMVADYRTSLSALRAALKGPVGEPALDYNQGFSLLLPHLAPTRWAARWLSLEAMTELHEGNVSNAFEDLTALPGITRMFEREPIVVSQMVRVANANAGVEATWEGLQCTNCTDAELAALQNAWSATHFLDAMEPAARMERATMGIAFSEARKSFSDFNVLSGMTGATGSSGGDGSLGQILANPAEGWQALQNGYPRYWGWKWKGSYEEEVCYMQSCQAVMEAIRAMKTNSGFAGEMKKLDGELARINQEHTNALEQFAFGQMAGTLRNWVLKAGEMEMEKGLVVTAIALKRYQIKEGKYPARLEDLVPAYLDKVPLDFMDGMPLRYHANADGTFLLYSVGDDGEDNGADATVLPSAGASTNSWWKGRDAVWPMPATDAEATAYVKKTMNVWRKRKGVAPEK